MELKNSNKDLETGVVMFQIEVTDPTKSISNVSILHLEGSFYYFAVHTKEKRPEYSFFSGSEDSRQYVGITFWLGSEDNPINASVRIYSATEDMFGYMLAPIEERYGIDAIMFKLPENLTKVVASYKLK